MWVIGFVPIRKRELDNEKENMGGERTSPAPATATARAPLTARCKRRKRESKKEREERGGVASGVKLSGGAIAGLGDAQVREEEYRGRDRVCERG